MVREGEGPEYESPAMELWLDCGLRTPGIYQRSQEAYAAHLDSLPADERDAYRTRHRLFRLAFSTAEMKEGIRNEQRKTRVITEHLRRKGISSDATAEFFRAVNNTRLQRIQGIVPDGYPAWDDDFMVGRTLLQAVGRECLPNYIREGFREWEESPESLSCAEYMAAAEHYNICQTCATDWIEDDWKYGTAALAAAELGEPEALDIMRTALVERKERLAAG